jgi:hypothetical protein
MTNKKPLNTAAESKKSDLPQPLCGIEPNPEGHPLWGYFPNAHPIPHGLQSRYAQSVGYGSRYQDFQQAQPPKRYLIEYSGEQTRIYYKNSFRVESLEPGKSGHFHDQKPKLPSPSMKTNWPRVQTPYPFDSAYSDKGKSPQTHLRF